MAETRTTRMGMPQWSAGGDSPTRSDFNEAFLAIETRTARYQQDTRAARPAAGVAGRFYTATDTDVLYYDDGVSWVVVGARLEETIIGSTTTGTVTLLVKGFASQTAFLTQWVTSVGTEVARLGIDGAVVSQGGRSAFGGEPLATTKVTILPAAGENGLVVKRSSGTGNVFRVLQNDNSPMIDVAPAGDVTFGFGVTAAAMRAVSAFSGAENNSNSGTYVTDTDPVIMQFTAPPSGRVIVLVGGTTWNSGAAGFVGDPQAGAARMTFLSWQIHAGTWGSGTVASPAHDNNAVASQGENKQRGSMSSLVTGLTPGGSYAIRTMFRSGNGGWAYVADKKLIVTPVF